MGNKNKPEFDTDDIQLLKAIAKHGFVDMIYVYKFYKTSCKKETVKRRIHQMTLHHYIHVEKMFEPRGYTLSGKEGYCALCLGSEGLNYMRFLGYDVPNYKAALTKAAPYRIYHQVQIASACDSIALSYKKRDGMFVVDQILNEREATLSDQENQPDAIILFKYKYSDTIDHGRGLIAVFVEMERSYARWQRINAKIEAYASAIKQKKYLKELKLPIIAYRLLFISQTNTQFTTLKAKIELCNTSSIDVLIGKYEDVCNKAATKIYKIPHDDQQFGLLSELKKPIEEKQSD